MSDMNIKRTVVIAFVFGLAGIAVFGDVPATASLIPAPREMRLSGGACFVRKPPKMEKVSSIPPEVYELSITPQGVVVRYSDDAGAYYAGITLLHLGRTDAKKRDFAEFSRRAAEFRRRLVAAKVNCAPLK